MYDHVQHRYAQLWDAIRTATLRPADRPARGRHLAASFVVRVTDGALFRRLDRIRAAVGALSFAVAVPDHHLHLPVLSLGPIASRRPRSSELSPAALIPLLDRARALLSEVTPFAVDVGRVGATAHEVFAEVQPAGPILELHRRLAELRVDNGDEDLLPRFPLAHFISEGDGAALAHALGWFHERPIGRIPVTSVTLVTSRPRVLHRWVERVGEVRLGGSA